MHTEGQDIVRAIRRGLGMSQAEFAHALGWSPSTISKWESGRAEPNRLALKIILAYGEERRIRYRPRRPTTTLPALVAAVASPVAVPVPADVARPTVELLGPATEAWSGFVRAERPRWEAAVSMRFALNGRDAAGTRRTGWARSGAVVAATLCAALVIGVPMLKRSAPGARRTHRHVAVAPVALATAVPATPPAAPAAAPVLTPPPAPTMAELTGVTLLGGRREATFRLGADVVTVGEGDPLGASHATRIGIDGVDLADTTGAVRAVKLGGHVAVD